tara:strand:- start:975 stop:1745 length:771 start_codon:yes stop_codon:yes gene_type:complete
LDGQTNTNGDFKKSKLFIWGFNFDSSNLRPYLIIQMKKVITLLSAAFIIAAASVVSAQEASEKEFATYGAGLSISPFGPALNLSYNIDAKNTISVGFGGLPEGDVPEGFLPELDVLGPYTATGTSSWMGVFWRHRPFEKLPIGFNVGLASGQIENNLTASIPMHAGEDEYASYSVTYTENPVMYFGLNFGSKPVKGFQAGFDLGVLSTGGAVIQYTGDMEEYDEHPDDRAAEMDDIKSNFAWSMLPNIQLSVSYGF